MDPSITPFFDKDFEWRSPALGLQSDAFSMQGAAAETCSVPHNTSEPQNQGSHDFDLRYVEPQSLATQSLATQSLALHHQAPYYQTPKYEQLQHFWSEDVEPQGQELRVQHNQIFQLQGFVRSEGQRSSTYDLGYVHSVPSHERRSVDVNTQMQYLNGYSSTAYAMASPPYASNNISATLPLSAGPNPLDGNTYPVSKAPELNGQQAPNGIFNHWNLETPSNPARHSIQPKRLTCDHPGCGKGFGRQGDLVRHARDHQDGPKEYDCPALNCPRKGAGGFNRFDKLKSHISAKHPEIKVTRRANGTPMFRMGD